MLIEDDDLQLSASSLEALNEFMTEHAEQLNRFEDLKAHADSEYEKPKRIISMADFGEDWNYSQFWYDEATAQSLAEELLDGTDENSLIGLVSAPSVYVKIKELQSKGLVSPNIKVKLFEFDPRFELVGEDFIRYDYNQPLRGLPSELKNKFNRILLDPPFLNEDCQTKTALTVRWLTRPWQRGSDLKVMACSGERMRGLLERLYEPVGLKATMFEVGHKGLSNEFLCYSTHESERFQFLEPYVATEYVAT